MAETTRAKVISRLEADAWTLVRNGSAHDIYKHALKPGVISVPRHRTLSPGVARQIAKVAGWL